MRQEMSNRSSPLAEAHLSIFGTELGRVINAPPCQAETVQMETEALGIDELFRPASGKLQRGLMFLRHCPLQLFCFQGLWNDRSRRFNYTYFSSAFSRTRGCWIFLLQGNAATNGLKVCRSVTLDEGNIFGVLMRAAVEFFFTDLCV